MEHGYGQPSGHLCDLNCQGQSRLRQQRNAHRCGGANVLSMDFNAAVAYMEEWLETATDGETDELITLWRNVTQEIKSQFSATFQNINLYWFRAVLV